MAETLVATIPDSTVMTDKVERHGILSMFPESPHHSVIGVKILMQATLKEIEQAMAEVGKEIPLAGMVLGPPPIVAKYGKMEGIFEDDKECDAMASHLIGKGLRSYVVGMRDGTIPYPTHEDLGDNPAVCRKMALKFHNVSQGEGTFGSEIVLTTNRFWILLMKLSESFLEEAPPGYTTTWPNGIIRWSFPSDKELDELPEGFWSKELNLIPDAGFHLTGVLAEVYAAQLKKACASYNLPGDNTVVEGFNSASADTTTPDAPPA